MSDGTPVCVQKAPFPVEVEAGKKYAWCACGQSSTQPFCDGKHKGSDFSPVIYTAAESKKVYFCGCKAAGKAPLCDGTHNRI
ncbi:MAG: CDGSH iron-sulfur domain-containing protein [Rhodospirillales bacterium]